MHAINKQEITILKNKYNPSSVDINVHLTTKIRYDPSFLGID
jgi:hypothetical protein